MKKYPSAGRAETGRLIERQLWRARQIRLGLFTICAAIATFAGTRADFTTNEELTAAALSLQFAGFGVTQHARSNSRKLVEAYAESRKIVADSDLTDRPEIIIHPNVMNMAYLPEEAIKIQTVSVPEANDRAASIFACDWAAVLGGMATEFCIDGLAYAPPGNTATAILTAGMVTGYLAQGLTQRSVHRSSAAYAAQLENIDARADLAFCNYPMPPKQE